MDRAPRACEAAGSEFPGWIPVQIEGGDCELVTIRLSAGEPLDNLPRTLRDQGHDVLLLEPEAPDSPIHRLLVRKGPR